jgi:hypothetical protein
VTSRVAWIAVNAFDSAGDTALALVMRFSGDDRNGWTVRSAKSAILKLATLASVVL